MTKRKEDKRQDNVYRVIEGQSWIAGVIKDNLRGNHGLHVLVRTI